MCNIHVSSLGGGKNSFLADLHQNNTHNPNTTFTTVTDLYKILDSSVDVIIDNC